MRAILFGVLTLAACAQPAGPVVAQPSDERAPVQTAVLSSMAQQIRADMARLDQELRASGVVTVGIGQSADLGGGLVVRPIGVIEDSRCPNNVQCIWAGRLRVLTDVSGRSVELTLGEMVASRQGSVMLAVVSPGPWAEWPTAELGEKPAYRFGFRRS
jgi:hypothetical protein